MKSKLIPALALAAVFGLAGCSVSVPLADERPTSEPSEATEPSQAPEPVTEPEPAPEPAPANDMILGFGEIMTWENNMSISVSEPAPFTAGEYAAGVIAGQPQVVFTIVVTNGSSEVYEPYIYNRVSSGGQEASQIFDSGNPIGDIGLSPSTAVLPGQTVQWLEAYSIADPASITFQTSPGFEYKDAIFTNIPQ